MNALFSLFALNVMIYLTSMTAPDKTVQNLKDAYIGESTASAKYAAYAVQARKDGYSRVASLFDAASKSESIHAANHKSVLEKLGQKPDEFKLPEFNVKSTKENLEDAVKGETYEVNTMYPGFVKTSRTEDVAAGTKSFTWAMDTEKKHILLYSAALDAVKAGKEATLASVYYVCPKCGNTYNSTPEKSCSFCMTPASKFLKFGK